MAHLENVMHKQAEEKKRFARLCERIGGKVFREGTPKHTAVMRSIDTFEGKGVNHMALRQEFFRLLWQNTLHEEEKTKEKEDRT